MEGNIAAAAPARIGIHPVLHPGKQPAWAAIAARCRNLVEFLGERGQQRGQVGGPPLVIHDALREAENPTGSDPQQGIPAMDGPVGGGLGLFRPDHEAIAARQLDAQTEGCQAGQRVGDLLRRKGLQV